MSKTMKWYLAVSMVLSIAITAVFMTGTAKAAAQYEFEAKLTSSANRSQDEWLSSEDFRAALTVLLTIDFNKENPYAPVPDIEKVSFVAKHNHYLMVFCGTESSNDYLQIMYDPRNGLAAAGVVPNVGKYSADYTRDVLRKECSGTVYTNDPGVVTDSYQLLMDISAENKKNNAGSSSKKSTGKVSIPLGKASSGGQSSSASSGNSAVSNMLSKAKEKSFKADMLKKKKLSADEWMSTSQKRGLLTAYVTSEYGSSSDNTKSLQLFTHDNYVGRDGAKSYENLYVLTAVEGDNNQWLLFRFVPLKGTVVYRELTLTGSQVTDVMETLCGSNYYKNNVGDVMDGVSVYMEDFSDYIDKELKRLGF